MSKKNIRKQNDKQQLTLSLGINNETMMRAMLNWRAPVHFKGREQPLLNSNGLYLVGMRVSIAKF